MIRSILLTVLMICLAGSTAAQTTVTLKAKNRSGKTQYFVIREASLYSQEVWGIKGEGVTGQVHSGDMWFNSFPGVSGTYKVELGAVLEVDGNPEYAISAGGRLLKRGRYPYVGSASSYKCSGSTLEKKYINCGEHAIKKGDKINMWGRSVYHCGTEGKYHGAYTRWFELRFTLTTGIRDLKDVSIPAGMPVAVFNSAGRKVSVLTGAVGDHAALIRQQGLEKGVYFLVAGEYVQRLVVVE